MSLKLAAKGVQDSWFVGNPQMSYFFMNYKRHSKFSLEQKELPFDGVHDFGKDLFCDIPYSHGDLVKNLALRLTINDIQSDEYPETVKGRDGMTYIQNINFPYVPSMFTELVEHVDLIIGNQLIERLPGEYIYIHQQLNNSESDTKNSLKKINGHGDFIDNFTDDALDDVYKTVAASMDDYNSNTFNTYILDLPFYFFRAPELSIPMCALKRQKIGLRLKLREFDDIIFGGKRINHINGHQVKSYIQSVSLEATFGFLEERERQFLMTRPLDYVITQVQIAQFNMEFPMNKRSVMLNFKNPVKEMFFVVQNDTYKQFNNTLRFQEIKRIELRFNNQVVFDGNREFLVYDQPMEHHVNIPEQRTMRYRYKHNEFIDFDTSSEFGMYSFALEPEKPYPTGQVNMSRISHQMLTVEIEPNISDVYCAKTYGHVFPKSDAEEGDIPILLRYEMGKNSPPVKSFSKSKDNKVRVYALSYNVLRVASGLAGLKF